MIHAIEPFDGNVKRLPKQQGTESFLNVFEANGKKYRMITVYDVIPHDRWMNFLKLRSVLLSGMEIEDILSMIRAHIDELNQFAEQKRKFHHLVLSASSMEERIVDMSNAKAVAAMYIATLFIYMDGEGPGDWTFALAEEKMQDWAKEGLDYGDFLELSFFYVRELQKIFLGKTMQLMEAAVSIAA